MDIGQWVILEVQPSIHPLQIHSIHYHTLVRTCWVSPFKYSHLDNTIKLSLTMLEYHESQGRFLRVDYCFQPDDRNLFITDRSNGLSSFYRLQRKREYTLIITSFSGTVKCWQNISRKSLMLAINLSAGYSLNRHLCDLGNQNVAFAFPGSMVLQSGTISVILMMPSSIKVRASNSYRLSYIWGLCIQTAGLPLLVGSLL